MGPDHPDRNGLRLSQIETSYGSIPVIQDKRLKPGEWYLLPPETLIPKIAIPGLEDVPFLMEDMAEFETVRKQAYEYEKVLREANAGKGKLMADAGKVSADEVRQKFADAFIVPFDGLEAFVTGKDPVEKGKTMYNAEYTVWLARFEETNDGKMDFKEVLYKTTVIATSQMQAFMKAQSKFEADRQRVVNHNVEKFFAQDNVTFTW